MRRFSLSPLARPEIEEIWIAAAREVGLRVERTIDAYASSDGEGRISIGRDEILDADDAAAQLIFHELCHALCEGPARAHLPDWGLDNSGARATDVAHEHACLRLQIHLASPYGLRALMAPTTEYRAYHDQLPADPLRIGGDDDDDDGDDLSVSLARVAAERAGAPPWRDAIARAMAQTMDLLRADAHPLGFFAGPRGESCGGCAWSYLGGRGKAVLRCRQSADRDGVGRRIDAELQACERWERPVDCHDCGACCREAYHSVTVSVRDPVVWRQPALIARHGHRFEILRNGDRCAALQGEVESEGSGSVAARAAQRFSCSIYDDRPQACRDFAAGGRHCLDARRRVGLSR